MGKDLKKLEKQTHLMSLQEAKEAEGIVDIEKISVNLLIIVKSKTQFGSVKQFLSRRGWTVHIAGQMNEAISCLVNKQPDFVLVSFNHPNPKLTKLPKLLAQTFNTESIGFCETPDLKTESKLTAAKIKYKLIGAASGPSIHRRIKQILGEILGQVEESDPTRISGNMPNSLNQDTRVQGQEAKNQIVHIKQGSQKKEVDQSKSNIFFEKSIESKTPKLSAAELLQKLQSELDEDHFSESSNNNEEEQDTLVSGSQQKYEDEAIESQLFDGQSSLDHSRTLKNKNEESELLIRQEVERKISHSSELNLQKGVSNKGGLQIQEGENATSGFDIQKGDNASSGFGIQKGLVEPKNNFQIQSGSNLTSKKNQVSQSQEVSDNVNSEKKSLSDWSVNIDSNRLNDSEGNLKKEKTLGFLDVLTKSVNAMEELAVGVNFNLSNAIEVGAIPIKSEELNGYIVVASNNKSNFSRAALDELKRNLVVESDLTSLNVNIQDCHNLEVIGVNIEGFIKNVGQFFVEAKYGDNIYLVGYIESRFQIPNIRFTTEHDKEIISLEGIQTNESLPFQLYIKLDKSERFLLYVNSGRKISPKQKTKLLDNNKQLYIQRKDYESYQSYIAAQIMNDLIDYYLNESSMAISG